MAEDEKRLKARDLNELIRYTMWAVFRVSDRPALDRDGGREQAATELAEVLDQAAGKGIVTRGCYDLQGMRADADYMIWWVAPTSDELQEMYVRFRRTKLGRASEPVWSAMALHRPAEFNKGHIPAFLAEEEPRNYVSVYPFVRSYEWYLLDPADRRRMLAEHGMMARQYPDVRANTVACFSLNYAALGLVLDLVLGFELLQAAFERLDVRPGHSHVVGDGLDDPLHLFGDLVVDVANLGFDVEHLGMAGAEGRGQLRLSAQQIGLLLGKRTDHAGLEDLGQILGATAGLQLPDRGVVRLGRRQRCGQRGSSLSQAFPTQASALATNCGNRRTARTSTTATHNNATLMALGLRHFRFFP